MGYVERTKLDGTKECFTCTVCASLYLKGTLHGEWTSAELEFQTIIIPPYSQINNTPGLCDYLFDGQLATLFGTGYSCAIYSKILTINFGQNAEAKLNSVLNPKYGNFYVDTCACPVGEPFPILFSDPVSVSFKVSTSPAGNLFACSPLVFTVSDITGTGNRPKFISVSYSVISANSLNATIPRQSALSETINIINQYLNLYTNKLSANIPAGMLAENAAYQFKITVTTYLDSNSQEITVNTDPAIIPNLIIPNGYIISVNEWDKLVIPPVLKTNECPETAFPRYKFNWTQLDGTIADTMNDTLLEKAYSTNDGILTFLPYELYPEHIYGLKLNATYDDFGIFLNAIVKIKVISSLILARISGGDRSIGLNENFDLDGSKSEDCIFYGI